MTTDPYRIAYEKAVSEVAEISAKLEQLATRQSLLDALVAALQPYFTNQNEHTETPSDSFDHETTAPTAAPTESVEEGEIQTQYSYLEVPNPLPQSDGNAFERRVKTTFRFKGLATQR
jgi:hypothetical protein